MARNMKGFVFTLDAFFALIVAGMGVSMLMYLQYTSTGAYQAPVQESYNLLQSMLHESMSSFCSNVSLGSIGGCAYLGGMGVYGFGPYLVQPYQSVLQTIANMYLNPNPVQSAVFTSASSSYINIPNTQALQYPTGQLTYVVWFETSSVSTAQGIMSQSPGSSAAYVDLYFGSNGELRYELHPSGFTSGQFYSSALSANTWYQAVMTFNGVTMTGYLNGVSQGSQNPGGSSIASDLNPLVLGNYGGYLSGSLADVQVYNIALSASQVTSLYAEGIGGAPIQSGLVGWWPLNGNANDYSGNGNTGTPSSITYNSLGYFAPGPFASAFLNDVVYPSTNATIFINSAYAPAISLKSASFNGANSVVTAGNGASLSLTSAITVEAWIDAPTSSSYEGVVDKGRDLYGGWSLNIGEIPNKASFKVHISGTNRDIIAGGNYIANSWTQLVGTFDGTTLKIYQNGTLSNSILYSGTIGTDSYPLSIGDTNDGLFYNGLISNVQLYSIALTPTQVRQLYKEGPVGAPISTSNVVGWWPLDGNANDYTINGNTGSPSNVVYTSNTLSTYIPVSLAASSLVSTASVPLILNASGTNGVYNVTVVVWR